MKFLFDLLPVILFFVAYKLAGAQPDASHQLATQWLGDGIGPTQAPILIATAVAIIATFAQIAIVWGKHRKVDTMLWVSLAIIVVFGGATLFFHNPTFIKWKPTALYWLFGAVLLGSALLFRRNLIRKMLEAQIQLPDAVWERLNMAWAAFFVSMGLLNIYIAYSFSEEAWVNFKLFGGMGLMLVFVLGQGFYLSRHIEEEKN
ncbi:septation protein A [Thauera linaloolentis]|uniref:Inner membrane-spanning protein YciB n=1 Tax=Thauera linaloolentis (strain DSM 12138 / JCM 21573 / CCUG 41526 / CIP 105981 / IAM 15112 / NBRC 102519 / 47Lol) TaxID=1123367 RepID=N6Y2Y4_THAL4|nr:septation protein A [Thauera linaloolentis]ENO85885.1 intracellular septation protein A [Thauera linaloolentis 47Lol = DSM 12138]MCM8567632.1 septation protein A [Thauera linaloolentis]